MSDLFGMGQQSLTLAQAELSSFASADIPRHQANGVSTLRGAADRITENMEPTAASREVESEFGVHAALLVNDRLKNVVQNL
ncbi:MAG: hypothetical protein WB117_01020 [Candidatus Acidiferrales bacterium]